MKLEIIKKVLNDVVFKNTGIEYNVWVEGPLKYREYKIVRIDVFVEVDKMIPKFHSYNSNYTDSIYNIEKSIELSMSLIGLPSEDLQYWVTFVYVNDDEMYKELDTLTKNVRDVIQNDLGIDYEILESNQIGFYYYGSESDNPYIKVEFGGDALLDPNTDVLLVDDEIIHNIVDDIYSESRLYGELELDVYYPNY